MALPSSPASTTHHPPRISSISSSCCPPSLFPLQIQTTSRPTTPAGAPYLLRVATASSTASSTRSRGRGRGHLPPPAALPDPQAAAALLLAAAGTVGAASLLLRSSSSSAASQQQRQEEQEQVEGEECPDCGGTGLCGRCKGEGFVFKQLSEETATKARKAAKNMATRYTAGYYYNYYLIPSLLSVSILASCISISICCIRPHQSPSKNMTMMHAIAMHCRLPTKWTYCNKCSSTRSCTTCRGSGRIITTPVT